MDGLFVKVKLAGMDEQVYPLKPRAIVAFEQKFGKGFGKLLGEEQKLEHIYYLGWQACRDNGVVVKPWGDAFLDTLELAELISDPNSESTETL